MWDAVRCGFWSKRNCSVTFTHVHQLGFQPSLQNLGAIFVVVIMWRMYPYSHPQHQKVLKPPHIFIRYMWDAVWRWFKVSTHVLWHCLHKSTIYNRILASCPKFGTTVVVVMVWGGIIMPIHNIRRCSKTLSMHKIDVGCSLKWFIASTQV